MAKIFTDKLDFKKDLARVLDREGLQGVKRHASVSINNKCGCNQCFCCYCANYLKEYDKKVKMYESGQYLFKAPPVCTALWDTDSWIKFIDAYDGWREKND